MLDIVDIPTPDQGNSLYPLPPDYAEGNLEYQRAARVNASRQYLIPTQNIELRAFRRVESVRFFDHYYLWPDPEENFESYFYDDEPRVTPDFHWKIVAAVARNRFNAIVAPRGAAKTTCAAKIIAHETVTRPKNEIVYATSTQDNAKSLGTRLRDSIYNNSRIHDDFVGTKGYGNHIKPVRGELPTGNEMFYLTNRSWIQFVSAQSRQRGKRPRTYVLDDPEYDASNSTDVSVLRESLDWMLGKVILPMMFKRNTSCYWLGTFVSKRHLLWGATRTIVEDGVVKAEDSRFDMWGRMTINITYDDGEQIKSCWPDMWPLTRAIRDADPRLEGCMPIEDMPLILGPDVFRNEMEGRPGEGTTVGFPNVNAKDHGYILQDIDELFDTDPCHSDTLVCWTRPSGEEVKLKISDLLANSTRIVTLDTAYTSTALSDWKVAHVGALLRATNELFSFDLFATKQQEGVLRNKAYAMARKWRASIHTEVVASSGHGLHTNLKQLAYNNSLAEPDAFYPIVKAFKPGQMEKTQKIETLVHRFDHGLIKLPFYKRQRDPWRELFHQIEEWNPNARDGGLDKDDHLDTLAMINMITRGMKGKINIAGEPDKRSAMDIMKDPDPTIGGATLIHGCFNQLSLASLGEIMEAHNNESNRPTRSAI